MPYQSNLWSFLIAQPPNHLLYEMFERCIRTHILNQNVYNCQIYETKAIKLMYEIKLVLDYALKTYLFLTGQHFK